MNGHVFQNQLHVWMRFSVHAITGNEVHSTPHWTVSITCVISACGLDVRPNKQNHGTVALPSPQTCYAYYILD